MNRLFIYKHYDSSHVRLNDCYDCYIFSLFESKFLNNESIIKYYIRSEENWGNPWTLK
jgi:hypothetical protein